MEDKKIELRITMSASAMARLKRQCDLLDVPPSTWARALIMERVTQYEAATASAMLRSPMEALGNLIASMGEEVEEHRKSRLEDSRRR